MAQQGVTVSGQPLPANVAQLISQYKLGSVTAEYEIGVLQKQLRRLLASLILLVVLTTCSVVTAVVTGGGTIIFTGAFLLVFINLIVLLWYLFASMAYRNWHIYMSTNGFLLTRTFKKYAFRWDQIKAVNQPVANRRYRVTRMDGVNATFDAKFANFEGLTGAINDKVAEYMFPGALNAYQSGTPVSFGRLSVDQQGIGYGRGIVAWRQVQSIDMIGDKITIGTSNSQQSQVVIPVVALSNAPVFVKLANHVWQEQRKRLVEEYKRTMNNPPAGNG